VEGAQYQAWGSVRDDLGMDGDACLNNRLIAELPVLPVIEAEIQNKVHYP
jgi:hypothetical protein